MSVKHFVVTEKGVGALRVGEMVAVATQRSGEQNVHWTLGSVESAPYVHDVEVRLWARVQEDDVNFGASEPETEEERALIEQTNRMREELSRSMQQATELTEKLRERRRSIIHAIEDTENHIAESRAAVHAAKTDVERISYRHWQELKSYRIPPKMVLTILRAVMLLLSEDGATEWPQMQRVLRDQHFKSRILEYDPRIELSSERADYVLRECVRRKSFRYVRAVKSSQAMGPIYYWVLAQLDSTEASVKKTQLEKKMISSKKELGEVMKEIQKQHESIAEYQALMDKTDDQLHAYREEQRRRRLSQQLDSIHKSRDIESARRRYEESFAAAEKKEYLRPAFYSWKPTDYCMVILRKNIIEDFGSVTQQQWDENKYILNEAQIHALDDALQRHRKSVNDLHTDEEGRKRREEEEDAEIEEGLFRTVVQDDSNDGSLNVIKREFNGEHWKPILDRKRLAIIKAFCSDTAEALQVQESDVSVTHLESFPSSRQLVICAEVQNTNFESKKNIQTIIRDYPYPKMEALYIKDAENFNQHQKRFDGKEWESIISTHKSDVKHVFELDTAAALNINHETDVNVTSVDFDDKLLLLYKVNKPTLTFNEVNNIVDNYPYPLLWGLYNAYKKEETSGIKQFHGSHWERALNTYKNQLTDAFKNDTARALDVPQRDIEVKTIKATDDALIFGYTTRVKQKDMDVQQAINDYDYPETWQLYKQAANQKDLEENVWTEHCSAFEGIGWREVVQEKRSALLHAFIKATAEIFDVEKDYLRNVIAKYVDQKLLFIFEFKHPASLTNANIVEKLESCEYVPVWALYREQVLDYKVVTTHEIGFEGEDWDYVMERKGAEVKEAVATETALALQLNREEILNVELETFPQRLSAIVTVKHSANMKKHQILEELTNRHYNQVWMLYQPRPLESSELTKRFDGDDWDIVLDGSRKKLEEAFRKETAAALNVSPHQVMLVSCRIGSLLVDFKVRGCTLSDEEITRLTDAHPYHEVYALYVPRIAPTGESCAAVSRVLRVDEEGEASPAVDVWTQHHVGFDGEGWHYVAETREADLHSAFVNGTVEAFKLEQENVRNVVMTCVDDGMLVDFELQHPDTLTDADVDMQLKECMYKDVWAVYREQLLEYKIVTTHEIGFEGEDWDYVMERKGAEVKEAVATETALALQLNREEILNVELETFPQRLSAIVKVRHSPLLSERKVEENLGQCDYRALWALYEARPLESSELTKRFDGDDWDIVLDGSRKKLEEAFRKETAAALNVSPHQVMLVSCRIGSLLVDFKVRGCTLSDEEITRLTDAHPYHEVYALYVPRIAPTGESCAAVSRVLRVDEEGEASPAVDVWTQHHVGFDGEGWHYVAETREADLHSAFVNGTVEAFKLEQENVRNVVMTCVDDGMLVDFELQHPDTLTDADVDMQLKECMYKDVWAVYREQLLEYKIVTTHEIGFEGEDWDYVMERKGAEVKEAVATETARGLGSEREDVVGVELDVLPQNLIAFVTVRHSPLLSERKVEENLGQCDYRALWALYEARPLESSELTKRFDGDDWDIVLDGSRKKLEEAFRKETAAALNVSPHQVMLVSCRIGSLLVDFKVRGCTLSDEEITRLTDAHPYHEVYALYVPRIAPTGESCAAVSRVLRVDEEGEASPAVDVWTQHHVGFDGEGWHYVAETREADLHSAFVNGTVEAFKLEQENVRNVVMTCVDDGMLVDFELQHPDTLTDADVDMQLKECMYKDVWAVYREQLLEYKIVTTHEIGFEGEDWDYVMERKGAEVKEAVATETARGLGSEREDVVGVELDVLPQNLIAFVTVRHSPLLSERKVEENLGQCDYRALWALYEARPLESSELTKRFDGDDWDIVLDGSRKKLEEAFRKETAAALNVSPHQVMLVSCRIGSLLVDFKVRGCTLSDEEITRLTDAHPYHEVYALYVPRIAPTGESCAAVSRVLRVDEEGEASPAVDVWTQHHVGFDGEGWHYVAETREADLHSAFVNGTVEAFKLEQENVRNVVMTCVDDGMLVDFELQHPDTLTDADVDMQLKECMYKDVWAVYREQLLEYKIVTTHEIGFEGEDWDYVMERKGAEVKEAVATETARGLGSEREDVVGVELDVLPQNLIAFVTVRHSPLLSERKVEENLGQCDYRALWALYEARPLESSELTKRFDGDDWDIVLDGSRKKLEEAFRKETAAALNVSPHQVMLVSCRIGSLLVDFKVRGCTLSDEEITRLTDAHPYHEVYALYVPRIAPTGESCAAVSRVLRVDEEGEASPAVDVWTQHHVGFDGEGWHYVAETREADLHSAFVNGTVEAFKLEQENVRNVVMTCVDDGMLVDFELQHPDTLTDADVDMQLKECMYKDVWAVYREQLLEYKIVTTHEIGFEGEDWDYVMERKGAEVKEAVATETARGLGSEREDVVGVELDVLPQNLIAFVTVRHSPLLSERKVEENLGQCDYRALWALYEARPLESSELTKRFDGDDWDIVLDGSRKKLEEAFRKETAAALNVSPHQVMLVSCRIGSLLVDFKVRGCTLSDEEITRLTDAHPYHEVYALYVPRIAPTGESCAAVSRVLRVDEEGEASPAVDVWTQHHVGFDGEGWHYVAETREADLHSAFVNGTVEAFKLEQENVRNVVMTCVDDGMLVDFELQHPDTLTDADVDMQLKECMYKDVWAVYREQLLEYKIVTTHEIGFEGEDWDYVMERKGAEVKEAVATETARGLGSEREDVVGVELDVLPQNLIAFVTVRHSPLLSERKVEENLGQCDYRALWALYEARPLESSELTKRFDGDDWDIVLDGSRKKLEEAFRKETAAALNVSPHQVMLVSCRIGSLLVDFKVRGCTLSDEEITRLTDAHPYHEVYALYVPRIAPTGESCAAVSRVLRVDEEGEASPAVDVWTQHHVGFDGEGWHYVAETREADLHSAFVNGTVEAFKLEQENVRNVVMTCVDDGMLVDFELQHPDALTDADVDMQLKECMYKDVWAVYREQLLEYKIVTTHEIGFEGEDWDYVMERKGAEVKEAVATETARGLGSEREDVVGVELDVLPQNLIAFVTVRHSPLLSERKVEENLGQCDYRALWALYEARPLESSELTKRFDGDDWDIVLDGSRKKLEEAFRKETAAALNVSPHQVMLVSCRIGSLLVDFKVRGCTLSDEEITRLTDAHPYHEVYALYVPRIAPTGESCAAVSRVLRVDEEGEASPAVDVWTQHHVGFDGEGWHYVAETREADLHSAFVNGTVEAFKLEQENVRNVVMTCVDDGMLVDFELQHPDTLTDADVDMQLKECMYKDVWAVYREQLLEYKIVTTHEIGFEGEDWDYVMERKGAEVKEAVATETARGLGSEREDVVGVELDVLPQNLIAFVTVRHSPLLSERKVEENLGQCDYRALWALYEARPLESSELTKRFDGDDWDIVLDGSRKKLEEAFRKETAAALNVSPHQVMLVSCRIGSLLVDFKVRGCTLSDEEITRLTDAHPYHEVYALYVPRIAPTGESCAAVSRVLRVDEEGEASPAVDVWTQHHVGFDGEGWHYVAETREADLHSAFVNGTVEAFKLEQENVRNVVMTCVDDGMLVDFELQHPDTLTDADVDMQLKECMYKDVWAVYREQLLEYKIVTTHEIGFEGEDWDYVMERKGAEVKEAVATETARGLGSEREDVVGVELDVLPQNLIAFVTVRHSPLLSERKVEENLGQCDYRALWALYEARPLESSELTKRFDGDDWDIVLDGSRKKLEEAFRKETAAALNVSPHQVMLVSCRIGSLLVDFKVRGCTLSDEEITRLTDAHPYHEVYALYVPRIAPTGESCAAVSRVLRVDEEGEASPAVDVWTQHHVGFDGEGWHYVAETREADLHSAFVNGTVEAFKLEQENVRNVVMTCVDDGMLVDFELQHPDTLTDADVDMQLKECMYKDVWAVYREQLLEYKIVTTHEIGFEGEDWDYVVERKGAEVKEAVATETARGLGSEREDVVGVELDVLPQNLIAFVTVRHSPLLSERKVEENLGQCDYRALWALYEARPLESSELTKRFDGDDWDIVLDGSRKKLEEAFRKETAAALNVSPHQVMLVSCRIGSLLVDFKVRGCTLSDEEITRLTDAHPYHEVYALYVPRIAPTGESCAAVSRVLRVDEEGEASPAVDVWTQHHVGFDGEGWHYVAETREADLHSAFVNGTVEAFKLEQENVRNVVMTCVDDGMLVDFELQHPDTLTDADVDMQLKECMYKDVWAVYREQLLEYKIVTTHEIGFEGEDWDYVMERKGAEVKEAVATETARGLGSEREDVVGVELDVLPQNLIAFVTVRHSPLLSERKVEENLGQCDYRALWALYEARPLESSELKQKLICAEEVEVEEDHLVYLRSALSRARRERDEYRECVESFDVQRGCRELIDAG